MSQNGGATLCLTFNSYTSLARSHERGKLLHISSEKLKEIGQFFDSDEAGFERRMALEVALGFGHPGMLRTTGDMYFSLQRVRSVMEDSGFEFHAALPGVIDRFQDLAVIRKPRT